MFLDQSLKSIQEKKNRLSICSDLRRRLVVIEVQGIGCGLRRTISNITMGVVVAGHIIGLLRERKNRRR